MFFNFRHRPNYKTRKIEASSLRSSREAGSGHEFKVFFPVSSGIQLFPISSGIQGIFPVRNGVQGIVFQSAILYVEIFQLVMSKGRFWLQVFHL